MGILPPYHHSLKKWLEREVQAIFSAAEKIMTVFSDTTSRCRLPLG